MSSHITKTYLRQLYIRQSLSVETIAEMTNTPDPETIRQLLDQYGIRLRSVHPHSAPCPDVDLLRKLYVTDRVSQAEVCRVFDVHHTVLHRWLDQAGIPKRTGRVTSRKAGNVDGG